MKKRLSFLVVGLTILCSVANAQDKSIPLSTIKNGWGYGCRFLYEQMNPGASAGIGCNSAFVTKIFVNGWNGSFGLADTTSAFTWSSITDWSKYNKIELLVYPEVACSFDDSISYKGWNNTTQKNVIVDVISMDTKQLIANQWNKVSIDLTVALKDKSNNTYTSLGDPNLGLNDVQFNYIGLPSAAGGTIYIGAITLKDKTSTGSDIETKSAFEISPNPASSSITISNEGIENAKIVISTVTGIDVLSTKTVSDKTTIDVSSLSAGIYIVSIVTPQGTQSQKLIIK